MTSPFYLVVWLVMQDEAGRILLGRRDGTTYMNGLWGLPGGRVERGEALMNAAVREVEEEMGLRVEVASLRALGVSRFDIDGLQGTDFLFTTRQWAGEPTPLDNTSEVGWFAPDALPDDCLPWLPDVMNAHLLNGVWLTEQLDGVDGVQLLRP
ncbi:NUDIX domain-containing protein [Deinococcus arenicola]|uniref:NUDIX domain-containing protein n=1 Tax=Deinococcus arenicola TaxID=2994950 RepID=A0ABU4DQ62_9DEIO|nr:NUDIX domain-containing protein [Deinococcus sp. ZS9-10]MDV6374234.1 NUDIX domain-containing protein [Deinococcus sp. ZS9-10]